jgi:Double zinc ribbon
MAIATFGIGNNGLNLVVNLLILMLVVVWLALIAYTYLDAKRRIKDPFLVGCATLAAFIPYLGTAVYAIVRPPEFLEDARERELEIKAAELRVRQLTEHACPNCGFPAERDFLRCPECQKRLKRPCPSCAKPVDPGWALCPYCETALAKPRRPRGRVRAEGRREPRAKAERPRPSEGPPGEPSKAKRQQRSPSREPDPDPRKA